MNKAIKIVSVVMLVILVIGTLATPVFAINPKDFEGDITTENADSVQKIFGNIIGIVQVVGTGIAIIMLIVLAIKYLTAAPEGKAEIKKAETEISEKEKTDMIFHIRWLFLISFKKFTFLDLLKLLRRAYISSGRFSGGCSRSSGCFMYRRNFLIDAA